MHKKHLLVIMGPAGCGKTSVATALADMLGMPMVEGDDYHSHANKQQMASNQPLTDENRGEWLKICCEAATNELHDGTEARCVFLSCSALKQQYRDVIRKPTAKEGIDIHFVYLKVDEEVLMERTAGRKDHYMKSGMVKSQLEALEEPGQKETDVVTVDGGRDLGVVIEEVHEIVERLVGRDYILKAGKPGQT